MQSLSIHKQPQDERAAYEVIPEVMQTVQKAAQKFPQEGATTRKPSSSRMKNPGFAGHCIYCDTLQSRGSRGDWPPLG